MKNDLVSIIIPSRGDGYLQRTIDDLLAKSDGEIEIIVVLDGIWPTPMVEDNERVIVIHQGLAHQNLGMRDCINRGVGASRGQYIMKIDEHCAVDKGFDLKLAADCKDNWVVMPRMYSLDADTWEPIRDNPIDSMSFEYSSMNLYKWRSWHSLRQDVLIDDCMAMTGSCYFMSRHHWDWLGGLDQKKYGKFHYESQEICLKTWLGGGRVVTNKKTWYAHWYRRNKAYGFSRNQYQELSDNKAKVARFVEDYWVNNRWEKRIHDLEWLIYKFWPVPYWPENWQQELYGKKKVVVR